MIVQVNKRLYHIRWNYIVIGSHKHVVILLGIRYLNKILQIA